MVTSSPVGIDCDSDCSEVYPFNTVVTLTATPGAGSTFAGWSVDPDCTDGQVTMNADKGCIATFNLAYTLGDVNNDSKINALDARMAQQHADGVITLTGNALLAADVDVDSDVDSDDATVIAKKGIGLPTGIPGFALSPRSLPAVVGANLHVRPGQTQGSAPTGWLLLAFTLPALVLLRRNKKLATLLLVSGLSLGLLTGCVEFAGLPPPTGPAIFLTSTSAPSGATRTINIVVQQITTGGGVAALQGRITYPVGALSIQSLTGMSGFVVKALSIDNAAGELRFSLVKPTAGGITNGSVARVTLSGGTRGVHTLSWAGNATTPIVVGGDNNVEITGYSTGNGQVKVR